MSDEVELRIAWASVAAPTLRSAEVLDDLVGRHRQSHRRYHGLRHVVWVLRHSRELEGAIAECQQGAAGYDAASVTAAACFHDAVYDPRADDNEERSAQLAENQLASLDWPPSAAPSSPSWCGRPPATSPTPTSAGEAAPWERRVLLDADLAVLGAEPAAYAAYVNGVRSEYAHLSRGRVGRRTVAVVERARRGRRSTPQRRRGRGGRTGRGPTCGRAGRAAPVRPGEG